MWIFVPRFPRDYLLILPRGLYPAPLSGYGWHPHILENSPKIEDFIPSVSKLLELLTPENFPEGDFNDIHLAGFSQGAALAFSWVLSSPGRVSSVAGLSGFLPEGVDSLVEKTPLEGKKIFIAHGTRDDLVPVTKARAAAETLQRAGAQVTYCEDNVGHKLSLNCYHGLQSFYVGLQR
jgi:phospholipase/carboxylesterase